MPAMSQDAALLDRGRYLVEVTAASGDCHTPMGPQGPLPGRRLAGGTVFDEAPFRAVAPNITPDHQTGIGRWSDAEIARAVCEGKRPGGSAIGPPMPFAFYRGLSDRDLAAMVAYLRSVPPVRSATEPSTYRVALPPAYGSPVDAVPPPTEDPVARRLPRRAGGALPGLPHAHARGRRAAPRTCRSGRAAAPRAGPSASRSRARRSAAARHARPARHHARQEQRRAPPTARAASRRRRAARRDRAWRPRTNRR